MLAAETVLKRHPDVVATKDSSREMMLLHLVRKRYYALDGTGPVVWSLIDGKRDLRTIGMELTRRFEVELPEAIAAVQRHAAELLQEELVVEVRVG
ncbi:MAG: PqqD family protein [Planctomycetota bacterium]